MPRFTSGDPNSVGWMCRKLKKLLAESMVDNATLEEVKKEFLTPRFWAFTRQGGLVISNKRLYQL